MNKHDDQPPGPLPLTNQGRDLLAIYVTLDEADRVLVWCALLERKGRRPEPDEGEA